MGNGAIKIKKILTKCNLFFTFRYRNKEVLILKGFNEMRYK